MLLAKRSALRTLYSSHRLLRSANINPASLRKEEYWTKNASRGISSKGFGGIDDPCGGFLGGGESKMPQSSSTVSIHRTCLNRRTLSWRRVPTEAAGCSGFDSQEQKWIVAVLFMVPVYASESIASLCYPKVSLACDILRNCYEAFALYSFGSYLVACMGGERRATEFLTTESRKQLKRPLLEEGDENNKVPERSFSKFFRHPGVLGRQLYDIVKFGLVQYMILKTLCAFLAFVLELFGVYGDGEFQWYYGYPYMAVVLNFSQMWALYCLVQFYNVTHDRLREIKPLAKFISFKAIVFATWWQGVGIALLCYVGVLPKEGKFQNGLQDFLICIEMAIAAIAHMFVFTAEPYQYVSPTVYGKINKETKKKKIKLPKSDKEKTALVETTETQIEAPGTSIRESVQDIVVDGGQHVVKDVMLTINQAMGPVEKGVTKIQESIHHKFTDSDDKDEEEVEIEEHVEENVVVGDDRV